VVLDSYYTWQHAYIQELYYSYNYAVIRNTSYWYTKYHNYDSRYDVMMNHTESAGFYTLVIFSAYVWGFVRLFFHCWIGQCKSWYEALMFSPDDIWNIRSWNSVTFWSPKSLLLKRINQSHCWHWCGINIETAGTYFLQLK